MKNAYMPLKSVCSKFVVSVIDGRDCIVFNKASTKRQLLYCWLPSDYYGLAKSCTDHLSLKRSSVLLYDLTNFFTTALSILASYYNSPLLFTKYFNSL